MEFGTWLSIELESSKHDITSSHLSPGLTVSTQLEYRWIETTGQLVRRQAAMAWILYPGGVAQLVPSGQPTKNDGKSPFSMGQSTINDINGHFQ